MSAGGPSIEQTISNLISTDTSFPRLDFAIGGRETPSGIHTPSEAAYFWHGVNDPVAYMNDPTMTLLRIFGMIPSHHPMLERYEPKRTSVLDKVMENFATIDSQLGSEDRIRMQAHQAKNRVIIQSYGVWNWGVQSSIVYDRSNVSIWRG